MKAVGKAAVTMKEVAYYANVSIATVSRTLLTPEKVAIQTRRRVEEAVAQTGYLPGPFRPSCRRTETRMLLIIAADLSDLLTSDIVCGINQTAAQHGYLTLLIEERHLPQPETALKQMLNTRQADGLILLSTPLPNTVRKLQRRALPPLIMANEFTPELAIPTVHIDNLTAAFNVVSYLYSLGHRRIACISGPERHPCCRYRLQGYLQALRRHNLPAEPHYIARGDLTPDSGIVAVDTLLRCRQPPGAVFCHNDAMALGALNRLKQRGWRVPQDISVVGFDDTVLARYCDPPLTTVRQPAFAIGQQATTLLLDALKTGQLRPGSYLLESEFVIRNSTAPPGNN